MPQLFYVKECSSTNDEIAHFVDPKSSEVTVLYTFQQNRGRGQYGNSWESSSHQNLAFSAAIPSNLVTLLHSLFNFHTATILRDFVANLTQNEVEIKWPNDLIIGGKKVSGILIERKKIHNEEMLIAGIGVNILQESFENLTKAGSIFTQTGQKHDLHRFAEGLADVFEQKVLIKKSEEEVVENYNRYLFRKNMVSCFQKNGSRQNGIIKNADEAGCLWIDLENDGLQKFFYKEIELLY